MKKIKVALYFTISVVLISCSTDSSEMNFEDEINKIVNADEETTIQTKNNYPYYGMPMEWHKLTEPGIVKIKFYPTGQALRVSLREHFAERFPTLVLVEPALCNTCPEYWFLNDKDRIILNPINDTGAQNHPEEDDPLQEEEKPMTRYELLLTYIDNYPFVDLYDNPPPADPDPVDPGPTFPPIDIDPEPFTPLDRNQEHDLIGFRRL